jgi:putative hydrolase
MKVDLHTHTVASGHAYNTILEIARDAADKKLEAIAITDHGPALGFIEYPNYFHCLRRVPEELFGVKILKGCEANVLDQRGNIDISEKLQKRLDIVLVGLHILGGFKRGSDPKKNTAALIKAIEKNRIHIIVHPFRPELPVEIDKLFAACLKHQVLLEINLHILQKNISDPEHLRNTKRLIDLVVKNKTKLTINSDAHFISEVADDRTLKKLPFKIPPEIIFGRGGYR